MPSYIQYGTTSTATNSTWEIWLNQMDTGTTTLNTTVAWSQWVSLTLNDSFNTPIYNERGFEAEPAARERRLQRERELLLQQQEETQRRAEANARAEALLLDNLTPEQQAQYRKGKHIIIVGGYSGTRYRIRHGRTGNIDVIDTLGRVSHRLCAHPRDEMPDADCVLIQKLALEADEQAFVKIANRHPSFDRVTAILPPLEVIPTRVKIT